MLGFRVASLKQNVVTSVDFMSGESYSMVLSSVEPLYATWSGDSLGILSGSASRGGSSRSGLSDFGVSGVQLIVGVSSRFSGEFFREPWRAGFLVLLFAVGSSPKCGGGLCCGLCVGIGICYHRGGAVFILIFILLVYGCFVYGDGFLDFLGNGGSTAGVVGGNVPGRGGGQVELGATGLWFIGGPGHAVGLLGTVGAELYVEWVPGLPLRVGVVIFRRFLGFVLFVDSGVTVSVVVVGNRTCRPGASR